jgi:hypothetical protein
MGELSMRSQKMIREIYVMAAVVILVLFSAASGAEDKPALRAELPKPNVPQPQSFCGFCHLVTYPEVFQKTYETWEKGKHKKFGCVDCHYPPKPVRKTHIPDKAAKDFSYVQLGGETVTTIPNIKDASCITADCHGKPDDDFKTKKIKFAEKVSYIHNPHLDKKNQIQGQEVHCTTCHQRESEKNHFEVSKESCFLCHFKNTRFAQGRGKCTLCHALPEKPIQTSGEKPITHQMLQDAKVRCGSCHYELIKGGGEIKYELVIEKGEIKNAQIMGGGEIKKESCLGCHHEDKYLKEVGNTKLMHKGHVTQKNARCFDCHTTIPHKKEGFVDPIKNECSACHPDHHSYQRLLAKGPKRKGITETPDRMFVARTNCLGCHVERAMGKKGELTLKGSGKTCVGCHTKDHDKMLKDWVDEVTREAKSAQELEDEAKEKIASSAGKVPKGKLDKARQMLKEAQDNLRIVEYGNAVHNKKYAMMLLDAAMNNLEDLIYDLEEQD